MTYGWIVYNAWDEEDELLRVYLHEEEAMKAREDWIAKTGDHPEDIFIEKVVICE